MKLCAWQSFWCLCPSPKDFCWRRMLGNFLISSCSQLFSVFWQWRSATVRIPWERIPLFTSFVWNMDGGIRLLFTFFHSARWLQFVLTRKTDWFPRLKLAKTANIHHIIILYSKHIKNESHIEYIIVRFKALKTDMEAAIFVRYIYRLCLLQNDIIKLSKQGC